MEHISAELKKTLDDHKTKEGFIKVTEKPLTGLTSEQKVILNRKGNMLFNQGRIDEASRIFITTGYSDGLTRVGDTFMKKEQSIKALKYYILAHNHNKSDSVCEKIAGVISMLIRER